MDLQTVISENKLNKTTTYKCNGIEIYVISDDKKKPWFRCSNICELVGYANTCKSIRSFVSKRNIKEFDKLEDFLDVVPKNSQPHSLYINTDGLLQLITQSRKGMSEEILKKLGIAKRHAPKNTIIDRLEIILNTVGIVCEYEYIVKKYCIDVYIPQCNLVIDIDGDNRKARFNAIKEALNCEIIMFDSQCEFDILIGEIIKYLMDHYFFDHMY